jgi:hypothetical protein
MAGQNPNPSPANAGLMKAFRTPHRRRRPRMLRKKLDSMV